MMQTKEEIKFEKLKQELHPLYKSIVRRLTALKYERDDILSLCYIYTWKFMQKFDETKGEIVPFVYKSLFLTVKRELNRTDHLIREPAWVWDRRREQLKNNEKNVIGVNQPKSEYFSFLIEEKVIPKTSIFEASDKRLMNTHLKMELEEAMKVLTEREKEVVRLKVWEELTIPEVANRLKLSTSYVSNLWKLAKWRLRNYYAND